MMLWISAIQANNNPDEDVSLIFTFGNLVWCDRQGECCPDKGLFEMTEKDVLVTRVEVTM